MCSPAAQPQGEERKRKGRSESCSTEGVGHVQRQKKKHRCDAWTEEPASRGGSVTSRDRPRARCRPTRAGCRFTSRGCFYAALGSVRLHGFGYERRPEAVSVAPSGDSMELMVWSRMRCPQPLWPKRRQRARETSCRGMLSISSVWLHCVGCTNFNDFAGTGPRTSMEFNSCY